MVKTTVYLEDEDAAALRRLAARSGRSQAEIIREAVAAATAGVRKRRFRSHGAGRGGGEAVAENARAILDRELGVRKLP